MTIERMLYAAVIACFLTIHYIAVRQIDAMASEGPIRQPAMTQSTD